MELSIQSCSQGFGSVQLHRHCRVAAHKQKAPAAAFLTVGVRVCNAKWCILRSSNARRTINRSATRTLLKPDLQFAWPPFDPGLKRSFAELHGYGVADVRHTNLTDRMIGWAKQNPSQAIL